MTPKVTSITSVNFEQAVATFRNILFFYHHLLLEHRNEPSCGALMIDGDYGNVNPAQFISCKWGAGCTETTDKRLLIDLRVLEEGSGAILTSLIGDSFHMGDGLSEDNVAYRLGRQLLNEGRLDHLPPVKRYIEVIADSKDTFEISRAIFVEYVLGFYARKSDTFARWGHVP